MSRIYIRSVLSAALVAVLGAGLAAQQMAPTPPRGSQGEGPFDRMVIRGITVIDGTGAQPRGPIDLVVEQNRITEVASVGFPQVPINQQRRPAKGTKEIDGAGPLPDAGLRRCARALRRRPGQPPGLRLQAVADARRHDRARRAVRLDGLGPGAARGVGEEPDCRAPHLRVPPPVQRRGLGSQPGRRRPRPRGSGCGGPPRRVSTASSSARTTPRSWRRCSTRPRSSTSARPRISIRWAWCG